MKKVKKVIGYILSAITVVLFILTFTILIIGIKANKENKIPQFFGYSYSVVPTNSMEPIIMVGDIVLSKSVPYEDVKVEDIIVFYSERNNKYIVHRVINITEEGFFITKGDNNSSIDQDYVTKENYIGSVIKIVPNIGKIVLNYRNLIFIIVIAIFIYIIVIEIIKIVKNINMQRKEQLEKELKEKYNQLQVNQKSDPESFDNENNKI